MDKKTAPFAMLKILQEYSDEDHILQTSDIIRLLEEQYHVKEERRTIYTNISLLRKAGFAISTYAENGRGYYMKERALSARPFTKSEILLLCNAIHASHFIDNAESEEMISKLLSMLSDAQKEEFRRQVYLPNSAKSGSDDLLHNIDLISRACYEHQKIAFHYVGYDQNRQLVKHDRRYELSPHYIVFHDDRPYVIVTSRHPGISHYRIDRITDLEVLDIPADPLKAEDEQEAYQYARDRLFMFAGAKRQVKYRCANRIMNPMIDLFGPEVRTFTLEEDPDHFYMVIDTTEEGAVFLAQQYLDAIQLIEPASLAEKVKQSLQNALQNYQNG